MMKGELLTGGAQLLRQWEPCILALYMQAFTSDAYAGHYLDEEHERCWIERLFTEHDARCYLWAHHDALAGFLLCADSGYDRRLPDRLRDALADGPTMAIAELAIAPAWRAHGLGTALVQRCLDEVAPACRQVIVRSNHNAIAAHRLYRRLGFEDFGTVRVLNDMIIDGRRCVMPVEKQYFIDRGHLPKPEHACNGRA